MARNHMLESHCLRRPDGQFRTFLKLLTDCSHTKKDVARLFPKQQSMSEMAEEYYNTTINCYSMSISEIKG